MTTAPKRISAVQPVPIWDPRFRQASMKIGGEPPEWMQVFPYPTYDATVDGKKTTLVTDDESQASIVEHFEAKGNDLVIDYEHQTDKDIYAPAAGRIVELVAGGKKGLLARCEWTDEAAGDIRSGRYFYDSPSFWYGEEDLRIYVLRHVALTNFPGSYNRPYITDHSNIDYGIKKAAAKSGGRQTNWKLASAKGGSNMNLSSFLESLRYAVGRPVTVTGKELRADLQKIIDVIPDTEDMIFLEDEQQKAEVEGKTIAQLLGDEAIVKATSQKEGNDDPAPATTDLKPVLLALDLKEGDANACALAIMNLKGSTAPLTRVRELEQQLATAQAKTNEERVELLIASSKNVLPHMKDEVRRIGSQSYELAKTYVENLPPIDLTSQSAGTEPPVKPAPKSPSPSPANETDAQRVSRQKHERTLEIVKEKNVNYAAANALRLKEEAAAQS